jgi:hypothetical protein
MATQKYHTGSDGVPETLKRRCIRQAAEKESWSHFEVVRYSVVEKHFARPETAGCFSWEKKAVRLWMTILKSRGENWQLNPQLIHENFWCNMMGCDDPSPCGVREMY